MTAVIVTAVVKLGSPNSLPCAYGYGRPSHCVIDIEVPIGPLHRDYVVDAQHAGRMPGKMAIMKARSEYDEQTLLDERYRAVILESSK